MSIIRRDLKDPRIGFVSITLLHVADLRRRACELGARQPEQQKESLAVSSPQGVIRHELAAAAEPQFRRHSFELDPSIEYSVQSPSC